MTQQTTSDGVATGADRRHEAERWLRIVRVRQQQCERFWEQLRIAEYDGDQARVETLSHRLERAGCRLAEGIAELCELVEV